MLDLNWSYVLAITWPNANQRLILNTLKIYLQVVLVAQSVQTWTRTAILDIAAYVSVVFFLPQVSVGNFHIAIGDCILHYLCRV